MENLKQQNIQFDIEQKRCFPELVSIYKDVVNVSLPTYTEHGKTEVVEDAIVAKKTYVCHDDEPQEESGWEFDVEDPFLEENQQTTFALPLSNLSIKIETLENQVKVLEDENVKVNEELKQCQTKLTKSIIKLKEYKNKNIALQDQVKALRSSSDGLDSAIEEVLTLRIQELENELKTNKMESEKNLADKNNLNKRIDALVASNEKIIESKKQQELELERLNMLVRQLQLQPKHDDPAACITKSEGREMKHSNEITNNTELEKLQKVIQELSIDNEELQALLDEQKSSYEEREKKLSKANLDLSFQVDELTKKIQDVREFARTSQSEELDTLQKNIQTYEKIILDIIRTNELDSSESEHINVNDSVNTFIKYLVIIEKYVKSLKQINDEHVKTILENKDLINNLNQQILDKSREIDNLQKEILSINNSRITTHQDETDKAMVQQTMQVEKSRTENQNYQLQINEMQSIIAMDKSTIAELNRQLLEKSEYVNALQVQYQNNASFNADVQNLHKYINELQNIIDCDKNTISSLQSELFEKSQKIEHLENIVKELSMIKKQNQDLKQEIEGHLTTISDLQNTLSASTTIQGDYEFFKTCNNEVLNLQQENLNLKQIIEQNKNVIDDLNTRLFDATSQIERLLHTNIATDKNEDFILKIDQYQKTIALLESELLDKNNKIAQMNFQTNNNEDLAKLQKQYDELNVNYINVCEDLNNIQSSESRSKRDIDELNKMIQNQQSTIINLEASLSEKSLCIEQLQNENSISANECGGLQQSIDELNTALEQSRSQIENMKLQLAEKTQKIELLEDGKREGNKEFKSRSQELEDKLRACNEQWSQVVEQRCREIADSWKVHLVDVESQFAEKEMALSSQIAELQQQIQNSNFELEKLYSSPKLDDEVALLRVAIEDKQSHVEALTRETEDMRFRLNALEEDNKNKDEKITLLEKEHSEAQSKSIENANEEIRKLNDILNKQRHDYINLEAKFDELSRTYEDFKHQSEIDISSKNINIEGLTKTLAEKCSELDIVSKEIQDLALTLEEERKQMDSMRSALESQELELVTLKEQLGLNADKIVSPLEATTVKKLQNQPSTSSVSNATSANQSELDLAMYMLHQRDMRCEELTMEVMSLLQERDTLQLRLSNALRLNESIRDDVLTENISPSNKDTSTTDGPTASNEADPKVKKGATVKKTKDFEMLKNKLSELHALDHSRDLRIFDDRKFRQEQQMALVERDFDKLPQEAKQQLIDADYTLSRDYQGPSTSLLNWLWGKGTKKVEHL